MKADKIILNEAMKGMGFVPNSLQRMSSKPNILDAFSMLFANIKDLMANQYLSQNWEIAKHEKK